MADIKKFEAFKPFDLNALESAPADYNPFGNPSGTMSPDSTMSADGFEAAPADYDPFGFREKEPEVEPEPLIDRLIGFDRKIGAYVENVARDFMGGAAGIPNRAGYWLDKLSPDDPMLGTAFKIATGSMTLNTPAGEKVREMSRDSEKDWLASRDEDYKKSADAGFGDENFGITSIISGVAKSSPEMMLTAGAGMYSAIMTRGAMKLGLSGVAAEAAAGGVRATRIMKYAKYVPTIVGTGTGATAEAILASGATGSAIEEDILGRTHEDLVAGSKRYMDVYLSAEGMPEDERRQYAKETIADEAGRIGAIKVGIATAAFGLGPGYVFSKLALGKVAGEGVEAFAKSRVGAVAKGAGVEATEEFMQSGAESLINNITMRDYADKDVDAWEGVLNDAITGGLIGGVMGGGMAAVHYQKGPKEKPKAGDTKEPPLPTANPVLDVEMGELLKRLPTEIDANTGVQWMRWAHAAAGGRSRIEQVRSLHELLETKQLPENVREAVANDFIETYDNTLILSAKAYEKDKAMFKPEVELRIEPTLQNRRAVIAALKEAKATPYSVHGTLVIPAAASGRDTLAQLGDRISRLTGVAATVAGVNENGDVKGSEELSPSDDGRDQGTAGLGGSGLAGTEGTGGRGRAPLEAAAGAGGNAGDQAGAGLEREAQAQAPEEVRQEGRGQEVTRTPRNTPVADAIETSATGFRVRGDATVDIPSDATPEQASLALEIAANDAATSPQNEYSEPSPEQIRGGNYRKGKVRLAGVNLRVENARGSIRKSVDGPKWSRKLKHHYGYLAGTLSSDGDPVDVYIADGAHDDTKPVFVIRQLDPKTGEFDEPKVVMGYNSEGEAKNAYLSEYPPVLGQKIYGGITAMTNEQFRAWVKSDNTDVPPDPLGKQPMADLRRNVGISAEGVSPMEAAAIASQFGGTVAGTEITVPSKNQQKVRRAIARAVDPEFKRVQSENERLNRELRTSYLTGLANKGSFDEDFAAEPGIMVAAIDMDGLKRVNTAFGHGVADQLIIAIGQQLKASAAEHGVKAYHRSGDEFAILGGAEAVEAAVKDAQQYLDETVIELTVRENGETIVYAYEGIGISYGIGEDYEQADQHSERDKKKRLAEGKREDPTIAGAPRRARRIAESDRREGDRASTGRRRDDGKVGPLLSLRKNDGQDRVREEVSPTEARGLRDDRGVRGSSRRLASERAAASRPLAGLPRKVAVNGELREFGPHLEAREAAQAYMDDAGLGTYQPPTEYAKVDAVQAAEFADAFEAMEHEPGNPRVREAYNALIAETLAQYQYVKNTGLKIEAITQDMGDPYAVSPRMAILDVIENNHLWFFPTDFGFGSASEQDISQNPLLAPTEEMIDGKALLANDVFRIVHDYFGHVKEGIGFRAEGEENAYRQHAAMYSETARRAAATELRGQNSWLNFGPHGEFNRTAKAIDTIYAEQKVGILPDSVINFGLNVRTVDQVDTSAFRRWFGESKVVDDDGRPLVVYHGTAAEFDTFQQGKKNGFTNPRKGFYFTDDKEAIAEDFGDGGRVVDAYLSINNPLDLRNDRDDAVIDAVFSAVESTGMEKQWRDAGGSVGEFVAKGYAQGDAFVSAIEAQGFDGFIMRDSWGRRGFDSYVAFRPEQIKSATSNSGAFDPDNSSIVLSLAPKVIKLGAWKNGKAIPFLTEFEEATARNPLSHEKLVMSNGQPVAAIEVETYPGEPDTVWVKSVRALNPRTGGGTRAMNMLTGLADKHGATLYLDAMPYGTGGMDGDTLKLWYAKHGFEPDHDGDSNAMVRHPETPAYSLAKSVKVNEPALPERHYIVPGTGLYSALYEALQTTPGVPKSATPPKWREWMDGAQRRGQFRQEEREFVDIDDALDALAGGSSKNTPEENQATKIPLVDLLHQVRDFYPPIEITELLEDGGVSDEDRNEIENEILNEYMEDYETEIGRNYAMSTTAYRIGDNTFDTEEEAQDYAERSELAPDDIEEVEVWKAYVDGEPVDDDLYDTEDEAIEAGDEDAMRIRDEYLEDVVRDYRNTRRFEEEVEERLEASGAMSARTQYASWAAPNAKNYREIIFNSDQLDDYSSSHFEDYSSGLLMHARVSDRVVTNEEGGTKKLLFIEEVQSDLHQAGRDKGYKGLGDEENMRALQSEMESKKLNVFYKVYDGLGIEDSEETNHRRVKVFNSAWAAVSFRPTDDYMDFATRAAKNFLHSAEAYLEPRFGKETADVAIRFADEIVNNAGKYQSEINGALEATGLYMDASEKVNDGVPGNAPFRKSWQEYMVKYLTQMAAQHGYDGIAWTSGFQQAERYKGGLSRAVDTLKFNPTDNTETIELMKREINDTLYHEDVEVSADWTLEDNDEKAEWVELHSGERRETTARNYNMAQREVYFGAKNIVNAYSNIDSPKFEMDRDEVTKAVNEWNKTPDGMFSSEYVEKVVDLIFQRRQIMSEMEALPTKVMALRYRTGNGFTFENRGQHEEYIKQMKHDLEKAELAQEISLGVLIGYLNGEKVTSYDIDKQGMTLAAIDGRKRHITDIVGTNIGEEIIKSGGAAGEWDSRQVIGGKGMVLQYDSIIPKAIEKIVKKFGGSVEKDANVGLPVNTPGGMRAWRVLFGDMKTDLMKDMPAYSLAKDGKAAARFEETTTAVESLTKNWAGAPPIRVLATDAQLDQANGDRIRSMGAEGMVEGFFDPANGSVTIIAANVSPRPISGFTIMPNGSVKTDDKTVFETQAEAIERVVVEEVLGHHGLRGVFDKGALDTLFDQVYRDFGSTQAMKDIADEYRGAYGHMRNARRRYADEFLSKSSPKTQPGLWSMLVSWAREHLRKAGFVRTWTDNDLTNLMERVFDSVRTGRVPGSLQQLNTHLLSIGEDGRTMTARFPGRQVTHNRDGSRTIVMQGLRARVVDGFEDGQRVLGVEGPTGRRELRKALRMAASDGHSAVLFTGSPKAAKGLPGAQAREDGVYVPISAQQREEAVSARVPSFSIRYRKHGNATVETILEKTVKPTAHDLSPWGKMQHAFRETVDHFNGGDTMLELKTGWIDSAAAIEAMERGAFGGNLLDAADSAYKMVSLTRNLPNVVAAVAKLGVPVFQNGSFVPVAGRQGLYDIFRPLWNTADGQNLVYLWEGYAVARRSAQLITQTNRDGTSKEKLLSQGEIDELIRLERDYPQFKKVFDDWQKFNRDLLTLAVDRGTMSQDEADLWSQNDYVPFFRVEEDDEKGPGGMTRRRGFSNQRVSSMRLSGSDKRIQPVMENIMMNVAGILDRVYKNEAQTRIIAIGMMSGAMEKVPLKQEAIEVSNIDIARGLQKMGLLVGDDSNSTIQQRKANKLLSDNNLNYGVRAVANMTQDQRDAWTTFFRRIKPAGNDIVSVMVNGKPEYYRVHDRLVYRAIADMTPVTLGGIFDVMGGAKNILTTMVTMDPGFMIANLMRDTLSSWVVSGENFTPLIDGLQNTQEIWTNGPLMQQMAMAGGMAGGFYNPLEDIRDTMKQIIPPKGAIVTNSARTLWESYRKIGMISEQVNRVSIARSVLARGGSMAEAAYQAQDIMNFSQRGDHVAAQMLVRTVPFLNARIQGLYRLYKGSRGLDAVNPSRARFGFAIKGIGLMIASLLLALRNRDDERFERLTDDQKDTYWHIFVGDSHFAIPKPFEVGTIFATIPERVIRRVTGADTNKELLGSLSRAVFDTLAFNPIPQLFKPMVEQWANKSFFSGRPIVGLELQGLEPEAQYNPWTSETARGITQVVNNWTPKSVLKFTPETLRSPVRLEAATRAYFGTIGSYVFSISDAAMRQTGAFPEAPTMRGPEDIAGLSRFYRGNPETGTNNKYANDLYDSLGKADDVYRTVNAYIRQNRYDEAAALTNREINYLQMRGLLSNYREALSDMNQSQRAIMNSSMSPDEKRAAMDANTKARNELLESARPYLRAIEE